MDPVVVDQIRLNFNAQGLLAINAAIGLMMLGVAIDLKLEDFKRIIKAPKAPAIGLAAQFDDIASGEGGIAGRLDCQPQRLG